MKVIVDNQIIKLLPANTAKILNHPVFLQNDAEICFTWPSLLEFLEVGSLFSQLPSFGLNEPIFEASIAVLCANDEREVLHHLYDRLFTENINQISALPQINPSFILQAIKEKREAISLSEIKPLLSSTLDAYETAFTEKASHTRHDLVLYLAWDRMCVWMAALFDYQSNDPKFIRGIKIIKECLIESYQHITQQRRTVPGIFRMLEAFLFYQMRQENLDALPSEEWTLLSQSFQALKAQDELVDFFYIDNAVTQEKDREREEISECYLTLESPNKIQARLSLAGLMIEKIKSETPNWDYVLSPKKIVYLESF